MDDTCRSKIEFNSRGLGELVVNANGNNDELRYNERDC